MKQLLCLIIAVLTMTVLHHVCSADEKREEKPRFKGVELYSWKEKGGDWMFVLLDGTNRLKTEEQVKGAKNKVTRCRGPEEGARPLGRGGAGQLDTSDQRIRVPARSNAQSRREGRQGGKHQTLWGANGITRRIRRCA
jgi:hypothetical protein